MKLFPIYRILYLSILAVTTSLATMACAVANTVCGFEFDAAQYGFQIQSVPTEDESSCGRFLIDAQTDEKQKAVISLAVVRSSTAVAITATPNNFVILKDGSLKFKLPERVRDSKASYFVRPLRVLSEKKMGMSNSTLYSAQYARRVDRLKKINDQQELEVSEVQRCVDAVRTNKNVTVIISGCDLAARHSNIYARVLNMLKAGRLPTVAINEEK